MQLVKWFGMFGIWKANNFGALPVPFVLANLNLPDKLR